MNTTDIYEEHDDMSAQSFDDSEDWTKLSDISARRRIQNRIAQRNRRRKLKASRDDERRRSASTTPETRSRNSSISSSICSDGTEIRYLDSTAHVPSIMDYAVVHQFGTQQPLPWIPQDASMVGNANPWDLTTAAHPRNVNLPAISDYFHDSYHSSPELPLYDEFIDPCLEAFDGSTLSSTMSTPLSSPPPYCTTFPLPYPTAMPATTVPSLPPTPQRCTTPPDNSANTPLHMAAQSGNLTILRLLLTSAPSPDPCNRDGLTPLHFAIQATHTACAALLLQHGASTTLATQTGKRALHLAVQAGDTAMLSTILPHVSKHDLNARDHDGKSAFHAAVERGDEEIVRLLLGRDGVNAGCRVGEQTPAVGNEDLRFAGFDWGIGGGLGLPISV